MFNVKIAFLSLLADLIGKDEVIILIKEESTINDVLKVLNDKLGEKFRGIIYKSPDILSEFILIGLNGKDIQSLNQLNTIISKNDELIFMPAIAGG